MFRIFELIMDLCDDHRWKVFFIGDFIISFTNTSEDVFKKSYGDINWKLTWNDNSWLINEIKYNVTSTKVGDDFNKQY